MGPVSRRLDEDLSATYSSGYTTLLEALDQERYFRLLDSLDDFRDNPPLNAARAGKRLKTVGAAVGKDGKRLRRAVKSAASRRRSPAADESLHEARKAAKRLRYAAEAAAPIDAKHARLLEDAAHTIQQVLGAHQDSVVARTVLRRLAPRPTVKAKTPSPSGGCTPQANRAWQTNPQRNSTTPGRHSRPNSSTKDRSGARCAHRMCKIPEIQCLRPQPDGRGPGQRRRHLNADKEHREPGPARPGFLYSPIVVGVMPGQDPALLALAAELAQELSAALICAYVDPASYLIEWNEEEPIIPASLEPALESSDEAALAARLLRTALAHILDPLGIPWTLRLLARKPALALETPGSIIGCLNDHCRLRKSRAPRPGGKHVNGSIARRLLSTQQLPVFGVPLRTTVIGRGNGHVPGFDNTTQCQQGSRAQDKGSPENFCPSPRAILAASSRAASAWNFRSVSQWCPQTSRHPVSPGYPAHSCRSHHLACRAGYTVNSAMSHFRWWCGASAAGSCFRASHDGAWLMRKCWSGWCSRGCRRW